MHKSSPLYDMPFDLGMLDPIECPPTPKLAPATTTIYSPQPMTPLAAQRHSREPSRSPPPLCPTSPTSESSGRSSPSTGPDDNLHTHEDNANDVGAHAFPGLRHTETPLPKETRNLINATIRSVPGHTRECSLELSCANPSARGYVWTASYPVPYACNRRPRTYMRSLLSQCQCRPIVYETPPSTASSSHRVDISAVTEWLEGISLRDELTRRRLEPLEKEDHAQEQSVKVLRKRTRFQCEDDTYDDLPLPRPTTRLRKAVYSDSEDEATIYYTSYDASSDGQEDEEVMCLILPPKEQKDLLAIQDAEWEELFQDLAAATAPPLRRRLRPGERNAPLVPSPLSLDPDCTDEIVDTVWPTSSKGVWSSYRRKVSLVKVEQNR